MNLATHISIMAGGQGSGRHMHNLGMTKLLTKKGYELRKTENKVTTHTNNQGHSISINHNALEGFDYGKWVHKDNSGKEVSSGYGRDSLKQHFKDIKAGGPGSGCKGDNCGRPSKGDNSLRSPYQEKLPGPEGQKAINYRQNAPAPLYKKEFDKEEIAKEKAGQAEMRDWQKQHQSGLRKETAINKGDEVKTTKVTKAFDNDKLESKNFKPGTTLTVLNVLPKVGNNPQLLSVQYPGRQGDIVHMPVTDVRLHRTLEGIQEKPAYKIREEIGLGPKIRPGKIEQQLQTPSGAKYIKLKPVSEGRPQGSGNIWKKGQPDTSAHSLKGQFSPAVGPKGNRLNDIFTFDLNLKSFGQGTARASVYDASYKSRTPDDVKHGTAGTTVIVWRDTKNKTGRVMEFDRDKNGYIKQGSKPLQQFNNLGHMGSYLNKRYGISMNLPGASVAKRKKK